MKLTLHKLFLFLCLTTVLFASCEKEYESIEEIDEREVQSYLQQNNLSFQEYNNTGIYYQIITPGSGADLKYTDQIFSTFTVKSLDGQTNLSDENLNRFSSYLGYFSSSNRYPEAFSTVIKEVVKKRGGKIRIVIPSHLAYGRNGNSSLGIAGNSSLDCTITVYNVNNKTEFEDIFVKQYFQTANININAFTRSNTGLYYQIINPGSGVKPVESSLITINYTGKLTNGTVFDQGTSTKFTLSGLINGWREGLPLIAKGGKIRLIVPPSLAYGSTPTGGVPAYSILDFEVDLIEVE